MPEPGGGGGPGLTDQSTLLQPSTLYYWHPQIQQPSSITEYVSELV